MKETDDFLAALREAGFYPKEKGVFVDDKWHSICRQGEKFACGRYSLTSFPDGSVVGCWFEWNNKDSKYGWSSKAQGEMNDDQRRDLQRAMEAQRLRQQKERKRQHERVKKYIGASVDKLPPAPADHPYLKRKGVKAHGLRLRVKGNELILPLQKLDGKTWTLERITNEGRKYIFKNSSMLGSFCIIGTIDKDTDVILECEGWATGASLHEATGLPVVVAINTANLKAVAKEIKKLAPKCRLYICADNDAWTKGNPGVKSAQEAAAVGAFVIVPDFEGYETGKPTDFNDLHLLRGLEAVRAQILKVTTPQAAVIDGSAAPAGIPPAERQHGGAVEPPSFQGDMDMNFRVLGHNEDKYYYFSFLSRKLISLTASAHLTITNLFRLDDDFKWREKFSAVDGITDKKLCVYAAGRMMSIAHKRGIFKEEDRVRGAGAWNDDGRLVVHGGDVLYVDGVKTEIDGFKTKHIYLGVESNWQPSDEALTDDEGKQLKELCLRPSWDNPTSGLLLAGWMVIAQVCGALPYRPHLNMTGNKGVGKSAILTRIVQRVVGDIGMYFDGKTTEPALRQKMGYDVRPIIYDESEPSANTQNVLDLARVSSTGGVIGKYGQICTRARFCFLLSSVHPPARKPADESRFVLLHLRKDRRIDAAERYKALLRDIDALIGQDFPQRLLTRTMRNMKTLLANIKVFESAARDVLHDGRAAEIVGAMLAGLYLLERTDIVNEEKAKEWIAKQDWSAYTDVKDDDEPTKLFHYLMGSILRYNTGSSSRDMAMADLAYASNDDKQYDKFLRMHGIAVDSGRVYFQNSSQHIEKMLKDSHWKDVKHSKILSRITGAQSHDSFYFTKHIRTSAVSIPLPFDKPKQEEIPF